MRALLLAATLVACAPSLTGFGALPLDTSTGDVAPSEDAGRPDVAPTPSDASDGAVAPDAAPVADTTPEATSDAGAAVVDVSADATDAADASDAREAAVCAATCEGLPHVVESSCINGTVCAIRRCERDFADCNRASADGCEVDLNDRLNCGSCGIRCPPRTACTNIGCV